MSEQYIYKEKHRVQYRERIPVASRDDGRRCTFCGAEVDEDDMFCPECGNALGGIRCPKCGALSLRNFCSNCNHPINELAQKAVSEAMRDPEFLRARRLAEELEQLEQQIARLSGEETAGEKLLDTSSTLSDEDRSAAASYAALFAGIAEMDVPVAPSREQEARPAERRRFSADPDLLRAAVKEYRAKAAELQDSIAGMLPDPEMPPEQQRNFFCARKITQIEMRTTRQEWVCNYCGCHHRQPSECVSPELGGKWLFVQTPHPITKIIYD